MKAADFFPPEGAPEGMIVAFLEARRAHAQKAEELAAAGRHLARAEEGLLRAMDAAGVTRGVFADLNLSAVSTDSYGLPAGALEDYSLFCWLVRAGGGRLVHRHVDRHEFSKFCRGLVARGKRLHPLVRQVTRRSVRITQKKEG